MKVIPAIDLLDGKVVRLTRGDYNKKEVYNHNPVRQAEEFLEAGFDHLHIVDLNGARSGRFENLDSVRKITGELAVTVQMGGGVRSYNDFEMLLEAGVSGVICSSMAVIKPDDWELALNRYSDNAILGMDLKDGKPAYEGWLETSALSPAEFLKPMVRQGLKKVLCTDVSRDGTLEGPNIQLYRTLSEQHPELEWIASGGVSSAEDLKMLSELNIYGVVVGKAWYEGYITLEEIKSASC